MLQCIVKVRKRTLPLHWRVCVPRQQCSGTGPAPSTETRLLAGRSSPSRSHPYPHTVHPKHRVFNTEYTVVY